MADSRAARPKRVQVKNACVNCQAACKKCDSARPCQRCVKYSLADSCVDSKRKPRQKGIKRGPYKKRLASGQPRTQSLPPDRPPMLVLPPIGVFDDDDAAQSDSPLDMLSDVALHAADSEPPLPASPALGLAYRLPTPMRNLPLSAARFDHQPYAVRRLKTPLSP